MFWRLLIGWKAWNPGIRLVKTPFFSLDGTQWGALIWSTFIPKRKGKLSPWMFVCPKSFANQVFVCLLRIQSHLHKITIYWSVFRFRNWTNYNWTHVLSQRFLLANFLHCWIIWRGKCFSGRGLDPTFLMLSSLGDLKKVWLHMSILLLQSLKLYNFVQVPKGMYR